ncbi:virulence-associated E family protein [Castellaniella sp. FW104-16D08]|uniref:virulence-associated E family protein n=1 Tax=unclassified Castellaniella TaxID=2617606 RepID=UPI00331495A9
MTDNLTVLRHDSRLLAKTWRADGRISNYDDAKYFKHQSVPLTGVADLSAQLTQLQDDPHACVIRGVYLGDDHATAVGDPDFRAGTVLRRLAFFNDTPHHWVLVEVDDFEPLTADPVRDPVPAIDEYIATCLPVCFQGAAYHWQLSNSAGHATKGGVLKVHIWFWLTTPYTSAQLKAWARALSVALDDSVLNPVQVHYTAAPVFEAGVVDPVPVRSGFVPGLLDDAVALVIDQATLDQAQALRPRQRGDLVAINDPVANLLIDQGRVLGESRDGGLIITCPWEDEHTNDTTGTDSTVWFPAGTNGYDRGHFKCLHVHCADRLDIEFFNVIGYQEDVLAGFDVIPTIKADGTPVPPPPPAYQGRDDKSGKIPATITNTVLACRRIDECGVHLGFDNFRDEIMYAREQDEWVPFKDEHYTQLRITLERRGFKPVGREMTKDAVLAVAKENQFDSAQLWLNSLAWDGRRRVDGFMARYFGTDDTPYTRAVGAYLWTALAGRVLEPGIKADMVPVLVGSQGLRKSAGVAAMVPSHDFFTEISFHEKDADLARKMRGHLLAEIGELRGLGTRDLESIKAFVTRTHEHWVPKFFEFTTTFPRRVVFIGTTNQDEFLADETGNRRWLPVRVSAVDAAGIARDCLQLWAEARELFLVGGVAFQDAERLAEQVHGEHMKADPWVEIITKWLDTPDDFESGATPRAREFLRLDDVMVGALRVEPREFARFNQQVAKSMKLLGFVKKQVGPKSARGSGWVQQVKMQPISPKTLEK